MISLNTHSMESKNCPNCKKDFSKKPSELKRCKFCSIECRKEFTKKSRRTKCKNCGCEFFPIKRKNRKTPLFCSRECMGSSYATLDYKLSFWEHCHDFVDGFLLGDGSISKQNCHLSWALKYQEFVSFIEKELIHYNPRSCRVFLKDARCKEGGFNIIRGNTKCHPDFKRQRLRWYPNGTKIVPKDVSLSRESVLIWYLSDGCVTKYSVRLCTDSFSQKDVLFLIGKLKDIGIAAKMILHCGKPRIYIPSVGCKAFFDYIGWQSPLECYAYKFNTYRYSYGSK